MKTVAQAEQAAVAAGATAAQHLASATSHRLCAAQVFKQRCACASATQECGVLVIGKSEYIENQYSVKPVFAPAWLTARRNQLPIEDQGDLSADFASRLVAGGQRQMF